jgi:isochorismate hydrolase
MKINYFTAANIERKAHQMMAKLADFRQHHVLRFRPREAALLIIDMQRYFLDEESHAFLPSAPAIVPGLKLLRDGFQRRQSPVIFTRHANNERNAFMLGKWWSDLIPEGDELSEIIPELPPGDSIVIGKTQYDAFYQTELEEILKKRGVTQVVITGVMAHLCCETTARSAFVRGFEVIVAIDGMATENEDFHMATLNNLSHGFAIPVMIKELTRYLEL